VCILFCARVVVCVCVGVCECVGVCVSVCVWVNVCVCGGWVGVCVSVWSTKLLTHCFCCLPQSLCWLLFTHTHTHTHRHKIIHTHTKSQTCSATSKTYRNNFVMEFIDHVQFILNTPGVECKSSLKKTKSRLSSSCLHCFKLRLKIWESSLKKLRLDLVPLCLHCFKRSGLRFETGLSTPPLSSEATATEQQLSQPCYTETRKPVHIHWHVMIKIKT
jgi:hypothetical protein